MFVENLRQKVRPETLIPEHVLITKADDARVKQAWCITLADLEKIVGFCRENQIPLLLIAFPIAYQYSDREKCSGPQKILGDFAEQNHVPCLDLLPPLADRMQKEGAAIRDYYLDLAHPTVRGNHVVAELVRNFMIEQGLVKDPNDSMNVKNQHLVAGK